MISELFCIECAKSCASDNDCFVCEICSRFFHKDCLALPNNLSLKSIPLYQLHSLLKLQIQGG